MRAHGAIISNKFFVVPKNIRFITLQKREEYNYTSLNYFLSEPSRRNKFAELLTIFKNKKRDLSKESDEVIKEALNENKDFKTLVNDIGKSDSFDGRHIEVSFKYGSDDYRTLDLNNCQIYESGTLMQDQHMVFNPFFSKKVSLTEEIYENKMITMGLFEEHAPQLHIDIDRLGNKNLEDKSNIKEIKEEIEDHNFRNIMKKYQENILDGFKDFFTLMKEDRLCNIAKKIKSTELCGTIIIHSCRSGNIFDEDEEVKDVIRENCQSYIEFLKGRKHSYINGTDNIDTNYKPELTRGISLIRQSSDQLVYDMNSIKQNVMEFLKSITGFKDLNEMKTNLNPELVIINIASKFKIELKDNIENEEDRKNLELIINIFIFMKTVREFINFVGILDIIEICTIYDILNHEVPKFLTMFKLIRINEYSDIKQYSDIKREMLVKDYKYKEEEIKNFYQEIRIKYNFEHIRGEVFKDISVDVCNVILRLTKKRDNDKNATKGGN